MVKAIVPHTQQGRKIVWGLIAGCAILASSAAPPSAAANAQWEDGLRSMRRGAFSEAVAHWQKAVDSNAREGQTARQIEAMTHLAASFQGLGQHRRALEILETSAALADRLGERKTLLLAKSKLAVALAMTRQNGPAEALLRECLEMARGDNSPRFIAAILNDLGNVLANQQRPGDALTAFEESAAVARQSDDASLAGQALCNAAATAIHADSLQKADLLNAEALRQIARLDASHLKAFLLLTAAHTDAQAAQARAKAASEPFLLRAHRSCQQALETAEGIHDLPLTSHALGLLGKLYAEDNQIAHALSITRRAAFTAQQAQAPDALYRWEWQAGRLLAAQGEPSKAIDCYRRAVRILEPIRHDLALGYGNAHQQGSFRETLGPLFFELADLLLEQARQEQDSARTQSLLREARDTVEQIKAVELEDYFQDDCVNIVRAKTAALEAVDPHSAVVYLIPLPTRTEILVSLASGVHQFTTKPGAEALATLVRQFRRNLETRTTYAFLGEARQLYDGIILPIRELLRERRIRTLVFVPDGALQTIPFASLHDGERFLIEEFAVATAPGLSLVEPRPIQREKAQALVSGLSDAVQGFPSLDFVPGELQQIQAEYQSETLLNGAFVTAALEKKLTQEQFSIVHIASHGQFNREAHKTFLLTYDGKLSLNHLEALIRPSQYRGRPVELLVLSACQTAAGDDRAALGLAGIAVKAGARSALASLWFVNDQSTAAFVSELYRQIRQVPSLTRAEAVRAAQINMLRDRRYRHPCYWAPYLLIGSWL